MSRNKEAWTKDEIDYLKKNTHLTDNEFSKHLSKSINAVRSKRRQFYLKHNFNLKYSINLGFFKIWSQEMAYVLGFIFADGYIRKRKIGSELKIKIKDLNLLVKINKVMLSTYPIKKEKITTTRGIGDIPLYAKTEDNVTIGIAIK